MLERDYQSGLIKELRHRFRGCIILKNDTDYLQGMPDLTILFKDKWAMLEVKASEDSPSQPNQEYYVDEMNNLSFAAFIYPENEDVVLKALATLFKPRRQARANQRE